jgi:hypothetical protein
MKNTDEIPQHAAIATEIESVLHACRTLATIMGRLDLALAAAPFWAFFCEPSPRLKACLPTPIEIEAIERLTKAASYFEAVAANEARLRAGTPRRKATPSRKLRKRATRARPKMSRAAKRAPRPTLGSHDAHLPFAGPFDELGPAPVRGRS